MRICVKSPGSPKWRIVETMGGENSVKRVIKSNDYLLLEISDKIGVVCNQNAYAQGMPFCCTFKKYRLYGTVAVVGLEDGKMTDISQKFEDTLTKMLVPAV